MIKILGPKEREKEGKKTERKNIESTIYHPLVLIYSCMSFTSRLNGCAVITSARDASRTWQMQL